LSFGDGNAAGSLETTPKAARGCGTRVAVVGYLLPLPQTTPPDHLVRAMRARAAGQSWSM